MKLTSYFGKEKIDDLTFIRTYIKKLTELSDEDIKWALSDSEEENENVQDLLMEIVLQFYATDLVQLDSYEKYLNKNKSLQEMTIQELRAAFIDLFHEDRVCPGSLIQNGIGKKQLLNLLVELNKRYIR